MHTESQTQEEVSRQDSNILSQPNVELFFAACSNCTDRDGYVRYSCMCSPIDDLTDSVINQLQVSEFTDRLI